MLAAVTMWRRELAQAGLSECWSPWPNYYFKDGQRKAGPIRDFLVILYSTLEELWYPI